jgi:hypothetical protein
VISAAFDIPFSSKKLYNGYPARWSSVDRHDAFHMLVPAMSKKAFMKVRIGGELV